jgi:hypothetical protein
LEVKKIKISLQRPKTDVMCDVFIDFLAQIPFLGFFHLFDLQKYTFPCSNRHGHTNYGAQIPFVGSEGLFSPF